MQFGVTMFPNNLDDVASGARLAEAMGFDYVGVADSQSLARELYVTLGVVAASTQSVMLGSHGQQPSHAPSRRHRLRHSLHQRAVKAAGPSSASAAATAPC